MIRKALEDDTKRIYELGLKYDNDFNKHYYIENYLNDDNYLINVLVLNDIIEGFIICTKIIDVIEIQLIYVSEECRHNGHGIELMNSINLRGYQRILLEVAKDNLIAQKLYEKMGFKMINIRKNYYHGVDALVMEKVIK